MINHKNRKHVRWLYDELPKLEADKVLPGAVSEKIRNYYGSLVDKNAVHPVLAIFYVMGSVLIGLGIILLIGYNWENLPRLFKITASLLPLAIGMGAGYLTYKKGMEKSWKEGVAVFWFLSIGATISLISQTYNIHGEIADFFLIWLVLGFPIIYVLKSPMVYFLYMAGAIAWASAVQIHDGFATAFWLFIAAAMPFYIKLFIEDRYSPVVIRTSFITAAAFTAAVGLTLEKCVPGLWMIIYSSLFCFIYMLSARLYDDNEPAIKKPYNWFSAVGIAVLMLILSYDWVWNAIGWNHYRDASRFYAQAAIFDYLLTVILPACAMYMMIDVIKSKKKMILDYGASFIIVIACYIFVALTEKVMGDVSVAAVLFFINIYIVYLSAVTIKFGIENRHMMTVNSGMFLFGILVVIRFLDMDLSLLARGIAFIIMGIVFIAANYFISKRISADEKK